MGNQVDPLKLLAVMLPLACVVATQSAQLEVVRSEPYGSVPGPNNVNDGALWKYNPKDGAWSNISPEKPAEGQRLGWGYSAVSVDAQHPSTIVATSIDRWGPKDEVFRSTDGGATFTKLDGVNGVDALGFGKAAPGKTFPAVYMLGNIGGLRAYYRSDDAGRTWLRINDDQHQFGVANRPLVTGDPRVYGRIYFTTGGRGVIYGNPAQR